MVIKIIISDFLFVVRVNLNKSPKIGMLPNIGILVIVFISSELINPPITVVTPNLVLIIAVSERSLITG